MNTNNGSAPVLNDETAAIYAVNGQDARKEEDDLIAKALSILDARMFTRGATMEDPLASAQYLKLKLASNTREVFACLFLDNKHRVIAFEEMFFGTIDSASVYPREIVVAALKHNACAVILAHNHPSGSPDPSAADIALTSRLRNALGMVDVRVLDHFVIGEGRATSMVARGMI
jgi:DNA repair protein radc